VPHEQVITTFSGYDFAIFPTLGENFGHAIAEALHADCPVLIFDRTPWWGLQAAGAAWDTPLEATERWHNAFRYCLRMGHGEHQTMSEAA